MEPQAHHPGHRPGYRDQHDGDAARARPVDHTWYIFTCVALATNVLGQFLLPTGAWARALTGWARDAKWRVYAQIFVENLIFVTIISLTEAWVHTGGAGIVAAWLATYVQLVLVGYVTSVVLFRVLE